MRDLRYRSEEENSRCQLIMKDFKYWQQLEEGNEGITDPRNILAPDRKRFPTLARLKSNACTDWSEPHEVSEKGGTSRELPSVRLPFRSESKILYTYKFVSQNDCTSFLLIAREILRYLMHSFLSIGIPCRRNRIEISIVSLNPCLGHTLTFHSLCLPSTIQCHSALT